MHASDTHEGLHWEQIDWICSRKCPISIRRRPDEILHSSRSSLPSAPAPISRRRFGMDMGLFSRMWETHFLWHQGYLDRARTRAQKRRWASPASSRTPRARVTLAYAAMLSQFHRDVDQVERWRKPRSRSAPSTDSHTIAPGPRCCRAGAARREVPPRKASPTIRPAIEVLQPKAGLRLPYYLALLAEACGRTVGPTKRIRLLPTALRTCRKPNSVGGRPSCTGSEGELLRSEGMNRGAEARSLLPPAIEVAHGQQAKSLELRAAVSLGRLWRDEGKRARRSAGGRSPGWFTEGFDTPTNRGEIPSGGADGVKLTIQFG